MFNFAVNADWLGRTPCRNIKLPRVKPLKRKLPDNDGVERLALELAEYGPMLWVGVLTGLRWAEVAGLRVSSVQLLHGNLFVTEQRTRDLDDDDVTAEPKSEAGIRPLAIDPVLAEILADHLAARRLTAADGEQLLFVGRRGGPLNYSHWRQRIWVPACDRAGLPGLQFHDLRRVNAIGMVAEGVDPKTAQVRFGHAHILLTLGLDGANVSKETITRITDRVLEGYERVAEPSARRDLPGGLRGRYPREDTGGPGGEPADLCGHRCHCGRNPGHLGFVGRRRGRGREVLGACADRDQESGYQGCVHPGL